MVGIVNQQLSYKSRTAMTDACKNLQGVLRATERATVATTVMQTIMAGTMAFGMLDRLVGTWDVNMDPDMTTGVQTPLPGTWWGNAYLQEPLIKPFMVWFIANMAFWITLACSLQWLMGWLADRLKGIITINMKLCMKIDVKQIKKYLKIKGVDDLDESFDMDPTSSLRKVSWQESNRIVWKGDPPTIDLYIDMLYGYIINATIVYNKNTGELRDEELKAVLIDELNATEVAEKTKEIKADAWKTEKKVKVDK